MSKDIRVQVLFSVICSHTNQFIVNPNKKNYGQKLNVYRAYKELANSKLKNYSTLYCIVPSFVYIFA